MQELDDQALNHVRFGYAKQCSDAGASNAMHCRQHGLSDSGDDCSKAAAQCEAAGLEHMMECPECNGVTHLFGYMEAMTGALDSVGVPAANIEQWPAQ